MAMSIKGQTKSRLRTIVHELFDARYEGAGAGRIYRAQGMADGYMRALIDLGIAKETELLALIDEEQQIAASKFSASYSAPLVTPKVATTPA
jgi:hypothetical protein